MCLELLYDQKEIDKLPETLTVYKVICISKYRNYGPVVWCNLSFKNGLNRANTNIRIRTWQADRACYKSGFHFFIDKKGAEKYTTIMGESCGKTTIITCQVNKEDIIVIGKQYEDDKDDEGMVIVTSQAIFSIPLIDRIISICYRLFGKK